MAEKVLDLRKKQEKKTVKNKVPQISWETPSFYSNPKRRYFILIVVALVASGMAMLFTNQDSLMAAFLLLASLVLVLYSNKKPEITEIVISQNGVAVGNKIYYYKDLKSFWIHYNPGEAKELSLELRKWYFPYLRILIENENPLTLRSFLIKFLPEKEHENSLVDIISRKLGL
ncbi:MAG: hypothetical protein A2816_00415 [Candidatus Yanofskybacteria bacterium RIFCSPHIGHO2_01_FULL_39_44]|nr:MAG: hypothetical protein A2816_00415 [Candidatus Yanofskybacteria bacterium RIFCSPHIGHO2_01_FULL_39_44]